VSVWAAKISQHYQFTLIIIGQENKKRGKEKRKEGTKNFSNYKSYFSFLLVQKKSLPNREGLSL